MSQHPSLRVDSVGARHRNVLKRFERIERMRTENRWTDASSVFHLPKIKSMKVKMKKIAEEKEAKPAEAGVGPAPAAGAKAPAGGKALAGAGAPAKAAPAKAAAPAGKKEEKAKK